MTQSPRYSFSGSRPLGSYLSLESVSGQGCILQIPFVSTAPLALLSPPSLSLLAFVGVIPVSSALGATEDEVAGEAIRNTLVFIFTLGCCRSQQNFHCFAFRCFSLSHLHFYFPWPVFKIAESQPTARV